MAAPLHLQIAYRSTGLQIRPKCWMAPDIATSYFTHLRIAFYSVLTECDGGRVWKDCGSACPPTCSNPQPVCIALCVRGCFCPDNRPIWHQGNCITLNECSGSYTSSTAIPS